MKKEKKPKKKQVKKEAEAFHGRSVRIEDTLYKDRTVCLFKPVDEDTMLDMIKEILAMDKINHNPIKMLINSPGGYSSDGLAMIDIMEHIKTPIHTIITGEACSMATFIALCGTKRYMTKNAYWMGHEMRATVSDYYSKMKYRFAYEEESWLRLAKMYESKTKLTKKDIETIKYGELWLDAKQCLKKGIVDKII